MKILSVLVATVATASSLLAQTASPAPPLDIPRSDSVLHAMLIAGPVMYALLALSVLSVMLVVTYLMTIRRGAVASRRIMATAAALTRKPDSLELQHDQLRHLEAIAPAVQQQLDLKP